MSYRSGSDGYHHRVAAAVTPEACGHLAILTARQDEPARFCGTSHPSWRQLFLIHDRTLIYKAVREQETKLAASFYQGLAQALVGRLAGAGIQEIANVT